MSLPASAGRVLSPSPITQHTRKVPSARDRWNDRRDRLVTALGPLAPQVSVAGVAGHWLNPIAT